MERRRAASAAAAATASAAAAAIATAAAAAVGSAAGSKGSICGGPGGGAVDDEEEGKDEGEGGATQPHLGLDRRPSPSSSPPSFLPKGKGAPGRRRQAMTALEVSIFNLQNSIAAHQANTVNEQILVKAADIVRNRFTYSK